MVTSNNLPDKKIVKMGDQNNSVVLPPKTLLGEVNQHITCPLCRGYYIDATTIVECLHSFCRSCIIKHLKVKSYCPECEMMINSAKPNIKPDKALQDIVYKLVPGLFQREMERRQQFYSSRPGPAATATPEQRGEDTERIIFSPEDVISFSLEYADATDTDSISSKSSDSNEPQSGTASTRRYLQCPAVVNISHLKKFISMKFDIDSTQFSIDILYKRVPLPDYYTLMDIAYIYNWKRNEPMRFFYQITDFIAIRTRYGLFDINRKGSHFPDRKPSPTPTEETTTSSPAPNVTEPGSEASDTDNPTTDDSNTKKNSEHDKKRESVAATNENSENKIKKRSISPKKMDEEVKKSQFLNSFELTAKSNSSPKSEKDGSSPENKAANSSKDTKSSNKHIKSEENLKRKQQSPSNSSEVKKIKMDVNKPSISQNVENIQKTNIDHLSSSAKVDLLEKSKSECMLKATGQPVTLSTPIPEVHSTLPNKDTTMQSPGPKRQIPDSTPLKRPVPGTHGLISPKRKFSEAQSTPLTSKTVSPLKLQLSKIETPTGSPKTTETLKHTSKKIPDLKPASSATTPLLHNKTPQVGKLRMDLLANNSDPTIDRSKILSQVKTSLNQQSPTQTTGDPLKSLFDSCKINIPSSLSITLTDQKLEQRNSNEPNVPESKKNVVNKNLTLGASATNSHKVPSPPVHNYIEIIELPDADSKKHQMTAKINSNEGSGQPKTLPSNKTDSQHVQTKTSDTPSAKGPVPSLKPISDTKLGKSSGNFAGPITFQQTFEQQLQSIQTDKTKLPKTKMQVPKLMPATPKAISAANKLNKPVPTNQNNVSVESKSTIKVDNALDLSTVHNLPGPLGPQQTKAFETMQSIANLAKKQNLPPKPASLNMTQNSMFSGMSNKSLVSPSSSMRIANSGSSSHQSNHPKSDKLNSSINSLLKSPKQDLALKPNITPKQINSASSNVQSPSFSTGNPNPQANQISARPSREQGDAGRVCRSPSSSPKLVIAEENQISSTQNIGSTKTEPPRSSPGPSKQIMKPVKSIPLGKMSGIRPPVPMNTPTNFHAMLRQHLEIQNAWQRFMSQQSANNKDNK